MGSAQQNHGSVSRGLASAEPHRTGSDFRAGPSARPAASQAAALTLEYARALNDLVIHPSNPGIPDLAASLLLRYETAQGLPLLVELALGEENIGKPRPSG